MPKNHDRKPGDIWPPEKVDALRRAAAEGKSGGVIANELGTTRSAILGKAKRLGISIGTGTVKKQHLPRPPVKPRGPRLIPRKAAAEPETPAPPPPPVVAPDSLALPLAEVPHGGCKWPVSGDTAPEGHRFCAVPAAITSGPPYCEYHRRRARQ